MKIRQATPNDAEEIAKVHIDSWREAYRGLVPDAHLDSMDYVSRAERIRQSLAANSEETYVAECAGHITGFITLGACRDADFPQDETGEIWGIYIAPDYRRKGIGSHLCKLADAQLRSRGYLISILWVFKDNQRACQFYETMGFAPDGATKMVNLGKELEAIRYRKELNEAEQSHSEAASV